MCLWLYFGVSHTEHMLHDKKDNYALYIPMKLTLNAYNIKHSGNFNTFINYFIICYPIY